MIRYRATHEGTDGSAEVVDGYNAALVGGLCNDLGAVTFNVADVHYILGTVSVDICLWLQLRMHTM